MLALALLIQNCGSHRCWWRRAAAPAPATRIESQSNHEHRTDSNDDAFSNSQCQHLGAARHAFSLRGAARRHRGARSRPLNFAGFRPNVSRQCPVSPRLVIIVHFGLNKLPSSATSGAVMPLPDQQANGQPTASRERAAEISAVERDVIEHFVEISRALGQPRSFAEIYGLLFISPHPLAMDDLCERLEISKGSVSQGLKFLRDIGAVNEVEIEEDRRTHYEAVAELRHLAGRFLRDQIGPRLAGSEDRLKRLATAMTTLPVAERAHVNSRVTMLQSWNKNTRRVLPLAIKLLGE